MRSVTDENPIHSLPVMDTDRSMGQGFNIVKMIEEHAPVRIKAINEELDALDRKHAELSLEKLKLTNLLTNLMTASNQ